MPIIFDCEDLALYVERAEPEELERGAVYRRRPAAGDRFAEKLAVPICSWFLLPRR